MARGSARQCAMAGHTHRKYFCALKINLFQVFIPAWLKPRLLQSNQEELPTAIPSTVFFVATKRCMYGGTELSVGPSTPLRPSEQCYGAGGEISGSNP